MAAPSQHTSADFFDPQLQFENSRSSFASRKRCESPAAFAHQRAPKGSKRSRSGAFPPSKTEVPLST